MAPCSALLVSGLLVAAVVTVACSGSSGANDAPAAAASQPAATATPLTDAVDYGDGANWICRPGKSSTPCDANLDATLVFPGGSRQAEAFRRAADPGIDCFYVYPTVSTDPGPNADLSPSSELITVQSQAARFAAVCRVFAPLYRQLTLSTIGAALSGAPRGGDGAGERAYGDVLAAWKHYLQTDNRGRGFVLIGHSQGASHLIRLIREEIDPNPLLRGRPPANSLFGRGNSLCVNPAAPEGGTADLHPYFGAASTPLGAGVTTPYVGPRGYVQAKCVSARGFTYLEVTADPSVGVPAYATGVQWGLHVYDVSLTIGDLVAMVERQGAAYAGSR